MSTRFELNATVASPLEHVWQCLADRSFWEAKLGVVGSPKDEIVSHSVDDTGIDVELSQVIADEHIPSAAKKIVGGDMTIERFVHYELAGLEYTGTSRGSALGGLLKVEGTLKGHESGGQTTEDVEGVASVSVPLLGGRLEKSVVDYLRIAQVRELGFVAEYMAR